MLTVVAMSGGVDSSVAAALTADADGAESTVGVALRLYSVPDDAVRTGKTCCAPDDLHDAARAARRPRWAAPRPPRLPPGRRGARHPLLRLRRAGALPPRGDRRLRAQL